MRASLRLKAAWLLLLLPAINGAYDDPLDVELEYLQTTTANPNSQVSQEDLRVCNPEYKCAISRRDSGRMYGRLAFREMEPPEGLSILCGGCHDWTELVGERSQRGDTIPQIEGSTKISAPMYCDNVTASFRGTGLRLDSEGELTSDAAELRLTEVFRSTWDGYKAALKVTAVNRTTRYSSASYELTNGIHWRLPGGSISTRAVAFATRSCSYGSLIPGGVREEAAFQMSAYSTAVDYEFINFTNKTIEGVTATLTFDPAVKWSNIGGPRDGPSVPLPSITGRGNERQRNSGDGSHVDVTSLTLPVLAGNIAGGSIITGRLFGIVCNADTEVAMTVSTKSGQKWESTTSVARPFGKAPGVLPPLSHIPRFKD